MAIIQKTASVWKAFRAGQELENAATWKNTAALSGVISAFLGALLAVAAAWGWNPQISQTDIEALSGGIVALISIYHAVVHITTSAKVGLGRSSSLDMQGVGVAPAGPPIQARGATDTAIPGLAADQRPDSEDKLRGKGRIDPDNIM